MSANTQQLTQGLPCHPSQAVWQWQTPRRVLHGRRLHWEHWKQPRPVVSFAANPFQSQKLLFSNQIVLSLFTTYKHVIEPPMAKNMLCVVKLGASYPVKIKGCCCILSVEGTISAPPSAASSPMNSNSVPARASIAFETSRMWLQSIITSHGRSLKNTNGGNPYRRCQITRISKFVLVEICLTAQQPYQDHKWQQEMAQRKNKEDIHYHSNLHPMCVPTPDSVKPNKWPKKMPSVDCQAFRMQIGAKKN